MKKKRFLLALLLLILMVLQIPLALAQEEIIDPALEQQIRSFALMWLDCDEEQLAQAALKADSDGHYVFQCPEGEGTEQLRQSQFRVNENRGTFMIVIQGGESVKVSQEERENTTLSEKQQRMNEVLKERYPFLYTGGMECEGVTFPDDLYVNNLLKYGKDPYGLFTKLIIFQAGSDHPLAGWLVRLDYSAAFEEAISVYLWPCVKSE